MSNCLNCTNVAKAIGWLTMPDMMLANHLKEKGWEKSSKVLSIVGVVARVALYVLGMVGLMAGAGMAIATGAATPLALVATPLGIAALSVGLLGSVSAFCFGIEIVPATIFAFGISNNIRWYKAVQEDIDPAV